MGRIATWGDVHRQRFCKDCDFFFSLVHKNANTRRAATAQHIKTSNHSNLRGKIIDAHNHSISSTGSSTFLLDEGGGGDDDDAPGNRGTPLFTALESFEAL